MVSYTAVNFTGAPRIFADMIGVDIIRFPEIGMEIAVPTLCAILLASIATIFISRRRSRAELDEIKPTESEPISPSDFTPRPTTPSTFPPELAPSQLQNIATKVAFMLVAPTIAVVLLLYGESDIALLFAILGVPVIIIIVFGWYLQSVKQQRLEGAAPHKKTPSTPTTKPTPLPKPTPPEQTSPPEPEPIPPSDFTPRPTTPSTFPPELAHLYSDPIYAGKGGFARVFKAKRKTDNKTIAIKIPISLDEGTGRSFLREITSWQRLNHENIITLYDANILPIPYLEMEYADAGSLDQMNKPVDIDTASEIILEIAEGLSYSHAQGVIHRDLKPMNVLLTEDLTPKISDWGLSKIIAESKTTSIYGFSPLYGSPEQISPKKFGKPDERTDIYQLGVIFYELLTGRTPFEGDDLVEVSTAIVTEEPVPPSSINPDAEIIDPIILKCLAKKKEDRYQNVRELQKDLASALKTQLKESLRMSVSEQNMKRSVFYCAEICLMHARLGEIDDVVMYLTDMQNYASEEVKIDVAELLKELERRKGMSSEEKISEEFVGRLKNLLHQVRMGR
jgi:serine/threonine protein kinase